MTTELMNELVALSKRSSFYLAMQPEIFNEVQTTELIWLPDFSSFI